MTAPLTYLRVILLSFSSALLFACHSGSSNNPVTPDVNTFHIYTDEQTIYSFNEDTGISSRRGEFDLGENQFIELNTDEDKQGYEYAVYVSNNIIYLLNYDKASNAKTIKLTEIASHRTICGIIPRKTSSIISFRDNKKSPRSTIDLPIIYIEYQAEGKSCSPEDNIRDVLDFSSVLKSEIDLNGITKSAGQSEDILGGLLIQYSGGTTVDSNGLTLAGPTGFLGQGISSNKLVFNYTVKAEDDQWETGFYPSSGAQVIHQASNNHVVIQRDNALFVLKIANLFSVNSDNNNSEVPIQEKIDTLFNTPSFTDLGSSSPIEFNESHNVNTFLIKHENNLYYYDSPNFMQIPSNETQAPQTSSKVKFDLTSDNTALVIQEADNIQTLLAISTVSGLSTTILSAEKIEFSITGNEFLVNTLELETGAGWQAHWFKPLNDNYTYKTYNNSRFIFAKDLRNITKSIYLLSSNSSTSEIDMIKPSLYMFDKNEVNGRKKAKDTSNSNNIVDFSFGQLNTDVTEVNASIVINDIYGRIVLTGINEDTGVGRSAEEYYYFNPSQSAANPSILKQSLKLITRKEL